MKKSYIGTRDAGGKVSVRIHYENGVEEVLNPRFDLANHSPDGFEWGYGGSGPSQLALAILADAIDDATALRLYQFFKWYEIAFFERDQPWTIKAESVRTWVDSRKDTAQMKVVRR